MINDNNINVLVTAGGTNEYIDPVRYIGNCSTGKMGIEIAKAFSAYGYGITVNLVLGVTHLDVAYPNVNVIRVVSAQDMYEACQQFADSDIVVCAAAVADYKPKVKADQKIKKGDNNLTIELERTVDILSEFGKHKKPGQFVVGFALETENGYQNAKDKMIRKNADMIVLNSPTATTGFGTDTNQMTIIHNTEKFEHTLTPLISKASAAKLLVDEIFKRVKHEQEA